MSPKTNHPEKEPSQSLERLVEISRSMNSSPGLAQFLQSLLSAAAELTSCDMASILELEEGKERLRFLAVSSSHRDQLTTLKVPVLTSVAGWVVQNSKPAVVPDVTEDPRYFKDVDLATGFVAGSLVAVPITWQEEMLGVLVAVNKSKHTHYTEEDLRILETLASQAAIIIQNDHLESKVQRALDQMTQLDHMKSEFIAIASHELRTPLGIILGHATFLRETIPPAFKDQLEIIVQSSMRLKDIIYDLAHIDNVQRGTSIVHAQMISMIRIIEEVMDSYRREAQEKQISMMADSGQTDLLFEGDSVKIAITLSNLVKNAITFTNPGGHVSIKAESIPGFVKVVVMDDGIGIPVNDLPHIFDRFYQVESHLTRQHGGMGLGLSVAKVMVEIHGGRIWAESVEGKGSSFTFLLPTDLDRPVTQSQIISS